MVQITAQNHMNLATNNLAIVCICDSEVDDNATIQCDKCGRWQHIRCVGIDPIKVDLDNLVYYCDQCEPRDLDVDAAKAYIERYQREEMETVQVKPRRGRGKGSGRRGAGHATNEASRPDVKRARTSNRHTDSEETDDPPDRNVQSSGLRDYTLTTQYHYTESALQTLRQHAHTYTFLPDHENMHSLPTQVKSINSAGVPMRGLFATRDAPANAFVGKYLGEVQTMQEYRVEPRNSYAEIRGPLPHVAFVQSCDLVIDARSLGNEIRYMRKSCSPNCSVVPLAIDSLDAQPACQFSIALQKPIINGDELTLGFQWPAESPEQMRYVGDNTESLANFARAVVSLVGPCACKNERNDCLIAKWLPLGHMSRVRSQTAEHDDAEDVSRVERRSGDGNLDQPMTREERKIQMAIARMESAEVPRSKKRRRDTGDDTNPPSYNRRASSMMKVDDPPTPTDVQRRSASPPIELNTNRSARTLKSRSKLIRSPSPDLDRSDKLPNKMLWLRTFTQERLVKEEQRLKLVEQAKEATARLAEEANRKKIELEAQARETREAKEREAERLCKQLEREAKEAAQRAREREIWGDTATPVVANSFSAPVSVTAARSMVQTQPIATPASNEPMSKPEELPGRILSPIPAVITVPKDISKPSTPAIPRKWSISEYKRQRKEKAITDPTPSPGLELSHEARDFSNGSIKVHDDKSDGEIEAGEVATKVEQEINGRSSSPTNNRSGYQQMPPTAPRAASLVHGTQATPGPVIHPSRAQAIDTFSHMPAGLQNNNMQYSPRHANFALGDRQYRQNGVPPFFNAQAKQHSATNFPSDAFHRPQHNIPSGPKHLRPSAPLNGEQTPNSSYYNNGDVPRGEHSNRPTPPPSR